jgi:oxygen-dependent protoporphyrinogen oxidase
MSEYDVIVIGAGISGLSFAHYCGREGLKTLVLEKDDRVGGTLHSHRFQEADGFWLELGAHTCYNSYGNLLGLIENCNILSRLIPREKVSFKMLVDGSIKSIPSQLNFFELLFSGPRLFTLKQAGQSIESYYSKIVGRKNYAQVIGPAMTAVISHEADNFPADMLFKKRPRRKDILKNFTLTGGLQTIPDTVSSQSNIKVLTKKEVRAIASSDGRFQIKVGSGTGAADEVIYETDKLVLSTPPAVAAKLLQESFPLVSEKLSRIKVESLESVGTVIGKEKVSIPPLAGLIPKSDSFYSVVVRDTVRDDKYRGFTFHFKPRLLNREGKLKRMAEVLGIEQGQLGPVVERESFVPALKTGHAELAGEIQKAISGTRLFITGNYFDGMAIEDCVTRSLSEFSRLKNIINTR